MIYDTQRYGRLLARTVPGVITDAKEYKRIEDIFNKMIDKGEDRLSPEEMRLFELLANLLESYERRTLPPLKNTTPAEVLSFLMKENDLKQKDLEDVFGSQANLSKVLSGEREISKAQAKKLSKRFGLSTDIFI